MNSNNMIYISDRELLFILFHSLCVTAIMFLWMTYIMPQRKIQNHYMLLDHQNKRPHAMKNYIHSAGSSQCLKIHYSILNILACQNIICKYHSKTPYAGRPSKYEVTCNKKNYNSGMIESVSKDSL